MRIKILPTSARSFTGVVQYNIKEGSELIAIENCLGDTADHVLGYLQKVTDRNARIKNPVFHVALSLAYDESDLSEDTVKMIVKDYMRNMGYADQPYGLFKHTDKDHIHYHIVSTRVDIHSGKKIDHNNENRRSLSTLIALISKYNLSHEIQSTEKGLVHEINRAVVNIMKSRPHSFLLFSQMCKDVGYKVEKTRRGVVLYKIDEREGRQRAINSSALEIFKDRGLDKRLKSNRYYREIAKREVISIIDRSLRQGITQYEYRDLLYRDGVQMQLHRNVGGVFGVSYKMSGFVFNGSDLGTSYSWNILRNSIILAIPKKSTPTRQQGRVRTPIARELKPGSGAGLYIGTLHGVDKKEDDEKLMD